MTFKMIYDERNRQNINKLADHTKIATLKWYQFCIDNQIQILIYETIRTVEQQKLNVAKGASQTMKSYHIVGQAFDFVPVDKDGNAIWNGYGASNIQKAYDYARKLGFELGYDWGWDSPHIQYDYKGYGTDTFGKVKEVTEKDDDELVFTSSTLKDTYNMRINSPTSRKLIVQLAVEKLGYSDSWLNKEVSEGDLNAMSLELAVFFAKQQ